MPEGDHSQENPEKTRTVNTLEHWKNKARKTFAVTGMAKRTKLPTLKEDGTQKRLEETREYLKSLGLGEEVTGGENAERERTLDERFERAEMYRILTRLRKKRDEAGSDSEKTEWNQRIQSAKEISEDLAEKLDILNNQYYSPDYMKYYEADMLGESVGIPVRKYSLKDTQDQPNADRSEKSEGPIVIIGGATSGATVTKSTAEAFALQYPNRDVYVIGYPGSSMSKITPELGEKVKEDGRLSTLTQLNKDVINQMGIDNFDLVGISMGGGVVLDAAKDEEFAGRINNVVAISPTNVQDTQTMKKLNPSFVWEVLGKARLKPKEWVRVPQRQPGYPTKADKKMGFGMWAEILRHKAISSDDLANIHVNGRVIIASGKQDRVISLPNIGKEVNSANEKRDGAGIRKIEFMGVDGGHHMMGDVYASGIVAKIRNTEELPVEISAKELPKTTAEVFVREDPALAPVADQITR